MHNYEAPSLDPQADRTDPEPAEPQRPVVKVKAGDPLRIVKWDGSEAFDASFIEGKRGNRCVLQCKLPMPPLAFNERLQLQFFTGHRVNAVITAVLVGHEAYGNEHSRIVVRTVPQ